jgi:hypothetical protein
MAMLFSRTLKTLPADLAEFVKYSKTNPDILFTEQTLDRLVQIVLNEQDIRISTKVSQHRSPLGEFTNSCNASIR